MSNMRNNAVTMNTLFLDKVTSSNQKVKTIKEKFNLKLKDVAGNNLSINCISKIITNKQSMTEESGKKIILNLNKLLNVDIAPEWLLESKEDQANRILTGKLKAYKEDIDKLTEMENVIKEYKGFMDKQLVIKAYEALVDEYKTSNYCKALKYIDKAIEISFITSKPEIEVEFKLKRANIEIRRNNIKEALTILESIEERTIKKDLIFKIKYNKCICHGKLEEFDKSISIADDMLMNYNMAENIKDSIEMIKGNHLSQSAKYKEAIAIYDKCLEKAIETNNIKQICSIHYNLADIYYEMGELDLAKEHIELRLGIDNDIYIVKHLLLAAHIFQDLKYINLAKSKLIDCDDNNKNKVYNKELELRIANKDIRGLKLSLSECICEKVKIENKTDLIIFLINNMDKEEVEKYLNKFKECECF